MDSAGSLIATSSFVTRHEKDLKIGLEVLEALEQPIKGH